jgi:Tfp pilus assembly protein PilX
MAKSGHQAEREATRAMRRVEAAAKKSERAVREMAKSAKRAAKPAPMPHRTAGDLLSEVAEKLALAVGMSEAQARELNDDLVEVWTRHYSTLSRR